MGTGSSGAPRERVATRRAPLVRAFRALGDLMLRLPRWAAALLALGWMGWITWLSSAPRGPDGGAPLWSYAANLAHGPLYGALAVLCIAALPRRRGPFVWADLGPRSVVFVLAAVGAFALLDEWHQSIRPGRQASWTDVATDLAAAAAVVVAARAAGDPDVRPARLVRILVLGCGAVLAAALVATVAG